MELLLNIELNEKALSVNKMYGISGASKKGERHKFLNKEFKEYQDRIIDKIGFNTEIVDFPVAVKIQVYRKGKRKFDIDNTAKPILDAITKSGFWTDDHLVYRLLLEKYPDAEDDKIIIQIFRFKYRDI